MRLRRAVSLAELLVVMSACSVILTMSATLMHRAMRTQAETRSFADIERNALRLARQLRFDAYHATQANKGDADEQVLLRLQLPDERVAEYTFAEGEVVRILSRGGKPASREAFAFAESIDLSVRQEDSPPRVLLTITGDKNKLRGMPLSMHVEVRLGRAHQYGVAINDRSETQ